MSKSSIAMYLLALAGAFLMGFAYPEFRLAREASAVLGEREALVADARAAATSINKLNGQYAANSDAINKILTLIPRNRQSDYITASVQNLALQNGVQLSGLTFSDETKKQTNVAKTNVSLDVTGRYPNLARFVLALENSLRVYDITAITFSKTADKAGQATGGVSGTIRFAAYSLR